MSPVIKIPFIFATTYALATSFTNPNPDVSDDERQPDQSRTFMFLMAKYSAHFRVSRTLYFNRHASDNAN